MSTRRPIEVVDGLRVVEERFSGGTYVSRIEKARRPYEVVAVGHGKTAAAARRSLSADLAARGLLEEVLVGGRADR